MENIILHKGKHYFKTETGYREVIASTNESLGLPKPSNKFLKKFCEYGGLKVCSVKLDYIHTDFAPNGFETFLKITSDNTVVTNLG